MVLDNLFMISYCGFGRFILFKEYLGLFYDWQQSIKNNLLDLLFVHIQLFCFDGFICKELRVLLKTWRLRNCFFDLLLIKRFNLLHDGLFCIHGSSLSRFIFKYFFLLRFFFGQIGLIFRRWLNLVRYGYLNVSLLSV